MAGEVSPQPIEVLHTDYLFRGISPHYYQSGQLTSGVVVLKRKHTTEQGPSVGIEKLISLADFNKIMGDDQGVAKFLAGFPVSLGLKVQPLPDPRWNEHANAHAVITAYQTLSDSKRVEVERQLRNEFQRTIIVPPKQ